MNPSEHPFASAVKELVQHGKYKAAQIALVCAFLLTAKTARTETQRQYMAKELLRLQLIQERELQGQFNFIQMKTGLTQEDFELALRELENENG